MLRVRLQRLCIDMMKNLLLALLLISPASFADWGDTYFCSTTLLWGVNSNGEQPVTDRKPKTFKFNLNKAKQSLVFSEGSPFGYEALDVTFTIFARDGQESFDLKGNRSTAAYHNGVFTYSHTSTSGARVVTADCDKF